jgi:hypothetical protein
MTGRPASKAAKPNMYRTLDSTRIIATLDQLERRIRERFPGANLGRVCAELAAIARDTDRRTTELAQPTYWLRAISAALILGGLGLIGFIIAAVKVKLETESLYSTLQGIEAGLNILIVVGAAVLFLVTLEGRWKRQRALADLDELRSLIHVIDMHQLTKDPSGSAAVTSPTPSSPKRTLSVHELVRYLDYCAEMLSLAAKIAALHAQSTKDTAVLEASSDLQQITANLSAKIWQKINIAQAGMRTTAVHVISPPEAAVPTPPPRTPAAIGARESE